MTEGAKGFCEKCFHAYLVSTGCQGPCCGGKKAVSLAKAAEPSTSEPEAAEDDAESEYALYALAGGLSPFQAASHYATLTGDEMGAATVREDLERCRKKWRTQFPVASRKAQSVHIGEAFHREIERAMAVDASYLESRVIRAQLSEAATLRMCEFQRQGVTEFKVRISLHGFLEIVEEPELPMTQMQAAAQEAHARNRAMIQGIKPHRFDGALQDRDWTGMRDLQRVAQDEVKPQLPDEQHLDEARRTYFYRVQHAGSEGLQGHASMIAAYQAFLARSGLQPQCLSTEMVEVVMERWPQVGFCGQHALETGKCWFRTFRTRDNVLQHSGDAVWCKPEEKRRSQ